MNRRQFFSRAAACAGIGALVAGTPATAKVDERAVLYGRAATDMSGGEYNIWLETHAWSGSPDTGCGVCVGCARGLKKGQEILWFPDGTVVGV